MWVYRAAVRKTLASERCGFPARPLVDLLSALPSPMAMTGIIRIGVVGQVNEAWASFDWPRDRRCGDWAGRGGSENDEIMKVIHI